MLFVLSQNRTKEIKIVIFAEKLKIVTLIEHLSLTVH